MNEDKVLELAKQLNELCKKSGLTKEEINAAGLISDQLRLVSAPAVSQALKKGQILQ